MAITNAIIKAVEGSGSKALTKAAQKTVQEGTTKALTRALTGAGISTLAKGAGSTLDGILGRSSGIILPQATVPTLTVAQVTGGDYNSLGALLEDLGGLQEFKSYSNIIPKKNIDLVENAARNADEISRSALAAQGISAKTNLPALNRDQYMEDTLGSLKNADGSVSKYVSTKDVPDYMQSHLTNQDSYARGSNDEILRDLFKDDTSSLSDLYERYDQLAQSANANEFFTPENINNGLAMQGKKGEELAQDISERLMGDRFSPKITKETTGTKNIKVSRPVADSGMEEVAAETTAATPIADTVFGKEKITGAAKPETTEAAATTATVTPETAGFDVKLKNGENIDISLKQKMSPEDIKRNRAIKNLDDNWIKGLNATPTQYKDVAAKSRSASKLYKTPAEMGRLNGISLDNINEAPQAVVNSIENAKRNIEKYAEERGVEIDLSNLDLSNIENSTRSTMKMQGIDPDKIRYTGKATPSEAETLYKDLRNRAQKTTDGDRAVAYNTMADYVRNQLDNTLDDLNIDFSYELSNALGEGLGKDAHPEYLRAISSNKGLKFSDLRREQADWIKIGNLSGRPLKEEPTINIFGIDTGAKNPFTAGAEKIKEKIYERQSYGGGAGGGNSGAGGVPPTGGTAAENNINFNYGGGSQGQNTLSSLLGKAKTAGLVGAGVLGGMALGGGGGGQGQKLDLQDLSTIYGGGETAAEADPYQTMTIGGYTYDQLENGYVRAMQAGDTNAAKLIANMMGMLDDKISRYQSSQKASTSGSGTAAKQKAALNVLSGLMQNYEAQGPIGGRFTQFMNSITGGGYNPSVAAYDSGAKGSLGTIIKALGDTGALSEGDQQRALALLPNTTDSAEAAQQKYQQLIKILQAAGAQ